MNEPILELEPALAAHVLSIFERSPFLAMLGVEVVRLAKGETELALDVRNEHLQQDGFVHAGVVTTLADHNAGACAATMAPTGTGVLTIELKINLLRPAKAPRIRCVSKVLKAGRTISVVESEVFDAEQGTPRLVAKATVTLAVQSRA